MDAFYNKAEAVRVLDEIITERIDAAPGLQMYGMDSEAVEKFGLTIVKEETNAASKLIQVNELTGEAEEALIAIQGIVTGCLLPPFEPKSSRPDETRRLAHARQSVTIAGLGSKSFNTIVQNSRHMYTMFSRYTPNAKLQPVPEFIGKYRGTGDSSTVESSTITASSRFFTPVKQASGLDIVDINAELDPRGVLSKVDASKWVHTEDNEIGDIVEIQASMLSLPSKGNYTVKLILRSIVLLDGHLTSAATTARTLAADTIVLPPPRRLKRQNPYGGYIVQQGQIPRNTKAIEAEAAQYQAGEELEESDWHNVTME
ncbi:hypothetical protein CCMSSC00406_0005699 [Pleurotus cornucopiae]|uniref:Uncharacterized protein n=1 Tax=Pleurotus cornucopiae TaxID=5321 RepID=A0ACB7IWF1_PLECO|nr:hypothetical protein CCMSSC00406_0005699 [Pleurotus cornucopiae]